MYNNSLAVSITLNSVAVSSINIESLARASMIQIGPLAEHQFYSVAISILSFLLFYHVPTILASSSLYPIHSIDIHTFWFQILCVPNEYHTIPAISILAKFGIPSAEPSIFTLCTKRIELIQPTQLAILSILGVPKTDIPWQSLTL